MCFPLNNVVPMNFPLANTIALVAAYSGSVEGLRATLDSLATTDKPNSHRFMLVMADGMVKGAGNDMTTPDIYLTMFDEPDNDFRVQGLQFEHDMASDGSQSKSI